MLIRIHAAPFVSGSLQESSPDAPAVTEQEGGGRLRLSDSA
jgi:hypothetical protein